MCNVGKVAYIYNYQIYNNPLRNEIKYKQKFNSSKEDQ